MSVVGTPYADTSGMFVVHNAFRREFGLLPDLIGSVQPQDADRRRVVAGHIRMLCDLLHHHHTAEDDVLWPLLLARAPKEIEPVVRLVEGHHQNIDTLMSDLRDQLSAWSSADRLESEFAGDQLTRTLQRLLAALNEHMELEEKLVLPVAERHVFATEWAEMESHAAAGLAPEDAPVIVGMVMYGSSAEILPAQLPGAVVQAGPQAYAAHCERVYGAPTPPRPTEPVEL